MSVNYPLNRRDQQYVGRTPMAAMLPYGAERPVRIPYAIWAFLAYIGAITIFGKGPSYLFRPPFIWGEITLVIVVCWSFTKLNSRVWGRVFDRLGILVAAFMFLGFGRLLPSLTSGDRMMAIRDSMIWYYGTFFFFGAILATQTKLADAVWGWLQRFWILALFWMILFWVDKGRIINMAPRTWREVSVLSNSGSDVLQQMSCGMVLMLMYSRKDKKRSILANILIVAMIFVAISMIFGTQGRGVKVSFLSAIFIALLASFGTRIKLWSFNRWSLIGLALLGMLGIGAILYGPAGLNRSLQSRGRLDRFVRLTADEEGASTARWRFVWWERIDQHVRETNPLFGMGFGRNLSDFNPFIEPGDVEHKVRSPHNVNVTVYARMGIVGSAIWGLILLLGLIPHFLHMRRCGFSHWQYGFRQYTPERYKELLFFLFFLTFTFVNSSFAVLMEGPVLGIWFWFALGFSHGRLNDITGTEDPHGHAMPSGR